MKKITSFNRENLTTLRPEIQKALATLAKFGITAKLGNCRFDNLSATFKFELTTEESSVGKSEIANDSLSTYGLKIGDQVRASRGGIITITGYNPRKRKNPIIYTDANGRGVMSSPSYAKINLIK